MTPSTMENAPADLDDDTDKLSHTAQTQTTEDGTNLSEDSDASDASFDDDDNASEDATHGDDNDDEEPDEEEDEDEDEDEDDEYEEDDDHEVAQYGSPNPSQYNYNNMTGTEQGQTTYGYSNDHHPQRQHLLQNSRPTGTTNSRRALLSSLSSLSVSSSSFKPAMMSRSLSAFLPRRARFLTSQRNGKDDSSVNSGSNVAQQGDVTRAAGSIISNSHGAGGFGFPSPLGRHHSNHSSPAIGGGGGNSSSASTSGTAGERYSNIHGMHGHVTGPGSGGIGGTGNAAMFPQFPSNALMPPFYNKPPRTVPPSPSLTNLILPSSSSSLSHSAVAYSHATPVPPTLHLPSYFAGASAVSTAPVSPLDPSPDLRTTTGNPSAVVASACSTPPRAVSPVRLFAGHETNPTSTPYGSDDEGSSAAGGVSAAVAAAAATAEAIRPTAPKVPTYEYYGFVLHVFSSVACVLWLLWSALPQPFLHALGIYYYPNRWWSLAIPSHMVITLVFMFVALQRYNVEVLTPQLNCIENIVDHAAKVAVVDAQGSLVHGRTEASASAAPRARKKPAGGRRGKRASATPKPVTTTTTGDAADVAAAASQPRVWCVGTDAVLDIPLAGVCEILYADKQWYGYSGGPDGRYDEW